VLRRGRKLQNALGKVSVGIHKLGWDLDFALKLVWELEAPMGSAEHKTLCK
jgi:hypothetical protein